MTIAVNTKVQVKFGKNIIEGEVLAELTENVYQVKNLRTGNIMTVPVGRMEVLAETEAMTEEPKSEEPPAEIEEVAEVAEPPTETGVAEVAETSSETETPTEEPSSEPSAKRGRKPRNGKSLMDIALETMRMTQTEMSVNEVLETAKNEGLFNPEDWGKTPAQTLYSSFMRETKIANGRVRKSANRGRWVLA